VRGTKTVLSPSIYQLDSTKRYDLFINVRDNMIINSTICFNCGVGITNGFTKVDTLEYQMAEPDGTLAMVFRLKRK
jgi:hypothetical protein